MSTLPPSTQQIVSSIKADGSVTLSLRDTALPAPGPDEVTIAIEATPINPSDMISLLPAVDLSTLSFSGTDREATVKAKIRSGVNPNSSERTAGLEGAGVVIAAGANTSALLGKKVAAMSMQAGIFARHRTLAASECIPLPEAISSQQGADFFCNPMTTLAIVETLHHQGHKALIHTGAASNLGQMLAKVCVEDNIPLVAVVRRQEQEDLLTSLGVQHICNSSDPDFHQQLVEAIIATNATVAFDAIGGGDMAHQLLAAMEAAAKAQSPQSSPYGTQETRQVYVYGRLDSSQITLNPTAYGMQWNVAGWAMPPILEKAGPARQGELVQRILANLESTFCSNYAKVISLSEALEAEHMLAYLKQGTGNKYLINPQL